jgi:hypothetical protein
MQTRQRFFSRAVSPDRARAPPAGSSADDASAARPCMACFEPSGQELRRGLPEAKGDAPVPEGLGAATSPSYESQARERLDGTVVESMAARGPGRRQKAAGERPQRSGPGDTHQGPGSEAVARPRSSAMARRSALRSSAGHPDRRRRYWSGQSTRQKAWRPADDPSRRRRAGRRPHAGRSEREVDRIPGQRPRLIRADLALPCRLRGRRHWRRCAHRGRRAGRLAIPRTVRATCRRPLHRANDAHQAGTFPDASTGPGRRRARGRRALMVIFARDDTGRCLR